MSMPSKSPSKKQKVASDAISTGMEIGYDIFSLSRRLRASRQRFYVFGRYDYYDSMFRMADNDLDDKWCGRQRWAVGVNYYPIPQIVVKSEYSVGILRKPYNNEPSLSIGIAYSGWFIK